MDHFEYTAYKAHQAEERDEIYFEDGSVLWPEVGKELPPILIRARTLTLALNTNESIPRYFPYTSQVALIQWGIRLDPELEDAYINMRSKLAHGLA